MREISPSPLTSKASSVGSHYDPLPCGLKKQGMNFTCPQLVLILAQCAIFFQMDTAPPKGQGPYCMMMASYPVCFALGAGGGVAWLCTNRGRGRGGQGMDAGWASSELADDGTKLACGGARRAATESGSHRSAFRSCHMRWTRQPSTRPHRHRGLRSRDVQRALNRRRAAHGASRVQRVHTTPRYREGVIPVMCPRARHPKP